MFVKFSKKIIYLRKTENVKILFKGICAKKLCKISSQKLCNLLPLFKAFQRAIKSLNPMTGCRSKYRFSRVKVK